MSVTFSPPVITGDTPEAQLKSMQSWLFQFSEQLQYTLNNLDTSNFSVGGLEAISGTKDDSKTSSAVREEFDSLKSLIIKTADTVDSYYEEITETLEMDYLAVSDFGTYSESANAEIVKNALGVTQYYERVEEVAANAETTDTSFNNYKRETQAYIRTGYIEQLDRYGVAIGEERKEQIDEVEATTFNLFATLTSDELAFWQNGVKLGYFKGDSLFVNGAVRIGRWAIDPSNGLTIKYV